MTAAENELHLLKQQLENGHAENVVDLIGALLEVEHAASGMQLTSDEEQLLQHVRELRHRIMLSHSAPGTVSTQETRRLLERATPFIERRCSHSNSRTALSPETISRIQRKYSQSGLSSEKFLRQKREDLALEDPD
jgi:hypothetical protein